MCGVTDALRFICNANSVKCRYQYYYYFKLYNITTLVAKCRINSFRLRGTGSTCHMFLLNVEFSNTCRCRVFQCHFPTFGRRRRRADQLPSAAASEKCQRGGGGAQLFYLDYRRCTKYCTIYPFSVEMQTVVIWSFPNVFATVEQAYREEAPQYRIGGTVPITGVRVSRV